MINKGTFLDGIKVRETHHLSYCLRKNNGLIKGFAVFYLSAHHGFDDFYALCFVLLQRVVLFGILCGCIIRETDEQKNKNKKILKSF